jgi:AbiV family abortive infection protein
MDTLWPNFLLFGAFFAAEQSNRLIVDANRLYDLESYGTSLALGAFSREEVGRARLLLRNRQDILQSRRVTLKSLRRQLASHVGKLKAALHPANVHVSLPMLGEIPEPGSEEEKNLASRLDQVRRFQEQRAPQETHEKRMLGLYVDISDSGLHWEKPCKIGRNDAAGMLVSAAIEYEALRKDLANPKDADHAAVLQGWQSRPELPEPTWPNWDW